MKYVKYLCLLVLIIINTGCSTYQISPDLKVKKNNQAISIKSYSINMSYKTKVWTSSSILNETKDVLSSSTLLKAIPTDKYVQNEDYFHMDIHIEYWHGGAGGDAFLSLISLGLIPTWGENKDLYKYKFNLYKNGSLYRENAYSIDEEYYTHILLLPFSLVSMVSSNPAIDFYKQALLENIKI